MCHLYYDFFHLEKRKSGRSQASEDDDMEEVTIGAHIISNLSDAFSEASNAFGGILGKYLHFVLSVIGGQLTIMHLSLSPVTI